MHSGNSIKIALINRGKNQTWLADQMDVSLQIANRWCNSETMKQSTMQKIGEKLDYKLSEIIALSE